MGIWLDMLNEAESELAVKNDVFVAALKKEIAKYYSRHFHLTGNSHGTRTNYIIEVKPTDLTATSESREKEKWEKIIHDIAVKQKIRAPLKLVLNIVRDEYDGSIEMKVAFQAEWA